MSVTVSRLRRNRVQSAGVNVVVRDNLQIIDQTILKHNNFWGRNRIDYDLPIIFRIAGIDDSIAQRMVYSSIIQSLKDRGFEVGLSVTTVKCTIFIMWDAEIDPKKLEVMDDIIRGARRTK